MLVNIIKNDITIHDNQFISVDNLIYLLLDCSPNTKEDDVLAWLGLRQDFLNIFPLIKISDNVIMPYTLYAQKFFNWHDEPMLSPKEYLKHLINGGYAQDYDNGNMLGFAKYQALTILNNLGIQIKAKYWRHVTPYIPKKSILDEFIDPYIEERLDYLENTVKHLSKAKIADTTNDKLPFKIEVLLKAHHYIHVLNHYSGEKGYTEKVKMFLEDMSYQDERYKAVYRKPTFIEELVSFLNSETRNYMSKIRTPE